MRACARATRWRRSRWTAQPSCSPSDGRRAPRRPESGQRRRPRRRRLPPRRPRLRRRPARRPDRPATGCCVRRSGALPRRKVSGSTSSRERAIPSRRRFHAPGTHVRALSDVATEPMGEREVRNVLAIPAFRRLWIALTLSSLGDWLGLLATTELAQQLETGYKAGLYAIASVLAVRLFPALVIGPFAGAWADRFNRRYTMVTADVLRFGLYASIPIVRTLWWLLVATFLIESLSLFWIPAKEASVPSLVPRSQLESANRLSLVTTYGSAAVASTLFALLAEVSHALGHGFQHFRSNPVDLALFFDAATFLVSAATIFTLKQIATAKHAPGQPGEERVGTWRSIAEGWHFLGSEKWLRGLVIGILGAVAAGACA